MELAGRSSRFQSDSVSTVVPDSDFHVVLTGRDLVRNNVLTRDVLEPYAIKIEVPFQFLNFKRRAVPDLRTFAWFEQDRPGIYALHFKWLNSEFIQLGRSYTLA